MQTLQFTLVPEPGVTPATRDQLIALGIPPASVDAGRHRFDIETRGPCSRVCGLAESVTRQADYPHDETSVTLYGIRAMHAPQESGYQMEGWVPIGGRKHRAFTSSRLFRLPDGKLVDVDCLYVCLGQDPVGPRR